MTATPKCPRCSSTEIVSGNYASKWKIYCGRNSGDEANLFDFLEVSVTPPTAIGCVAKKLALPPAGMPRNVSVKARASVIAG